jgi:hypothetical protein
MRASLTCYPLSVVLQFLHCGSANPVNEWKTNENGEIRLFVAYSLTDFGDA